MADTQTKLAESTAQVTALSEQLQDSNREKGSSFIYTKNINLASVIILFTPTLAEY